MKKFLSGLCATTLAASFALASVMPVNAAPIFVPKAPVAQSDVVQVQERRLRRNRNVRQNRREFRREARQDRRQFRRDGRNAYWGRHRGYRNYRRGYREHNGFWFPAAAFITGAIVGGALNNSPNVVYRGGSAHVQWCYDRWRSYRDYDNTYQPNYGGRKLCYSPYN